MGGMSVYKNKNKNGTLNLSGPHIKALRLAMKPPVSQRMLADRLQLEGLDLDKNAIQRIECGKRFVTDIEIIAIADTLGVSLDALLRRKNIL